MGWEFPPFYGKSKEFYIKKIEKNKAKIKALQDEIAFCEEQIKKDEK